MDRLHGGDDTRLGQFASVVRVDDLDVLDAVATWEARRDLIVAELDGLPLRRPAGSWSMLLDAGALGMTGAQASVRLFERGQVAATAMDKPMASSPATRAR